MKKNIMILLLSTIILGCSEKNDLNQNIEQNYEINYDLEEKIPEEELKQDIIETTRSEEIINIYDFSEKEIIDIKQRFFTQKNDLNVNSNIDENLIELIKSISLDKLEDGQINLDDLNDFYELTDKNFADTSKNYLTLSNKQFSLRYDYSPENIKIANVNSTKSVYLEVGASEALEEMFSKAKSDGVNLTLVSGYRDFDYQNMLFERKVASVGYESANLVVARPGESEHQTGFVVDISCATINYGLVENFENTKAFEWLYKNSPEYGYILRYNKDKVDITGYSYEPWHYRYIGDPEIARFITDNNLTLEEYHEQYIDLK